MNCHSTSHSLVGILKDLNHGAFYVGWSIYNGKLILIFLEKKSQLESVFSTTDCPYLCEATGSFRKFMETNDNS